MRTGWRFGGVLTLAGALSALAVRAQPLICTTPPPGVREQVALHTDYGVIRLELLNLPGEPPAATVANFLGYVGRGDYDGSFFHRLAPDFVLQGGGFTFDPVLRYEAIAKDPPVVNEYGYCNVRGSVTMAKVGGQVNSATSQFFINLKDNSALLEAQNGGFTVFARVLPEDLAIVDAIAALHTEYGPVMIDDPLAAPFTNLPVKSVLARTPGGFGCLHEVLPDPDPDLGPQIVHDCANQAALDAAAALWREGMDALVPPQLVVIERAVPEPGGVLLLAVGAALLTTARVSRVGVRMRILARLLPSGAVPRLGRIEPPARSS